MRPFVLMICLALAMPLRAQDLSQRLFWRGLRNLVS